MLYSTNRVRTRLEAERERLIQDIGQHNEVTHVRTRPSNHPADNATDASEKFLNGTLKQMQSRHLDLIENALRRLADGSYGVCESCGQDIDPARLDVQPAARRCVPCQAH